jgi:mRNA-degrading endonuclease RelE of RelBE toxin-antitoxin system
MDIQTLTKKIEKLPAEQQQQVQSFVDFLESQYTSKNKKETLAEKRRANRGMAKGMVIMADNFDDPLEDFEDYM